MFIYLTLIIGYMQFKLVLIIFCLSRNQEFLLPQIQMLQICFSNETLAHSSTAQVLVFSLEMESFPCC